MFVNRAQKEIGRVGAGRARPRGQRRRGFEQGKFEPEKKRNREKARKFTFLKKKGASFARKRTNKYNKAVMIKYIAYCRKSTDEKDKQIMSIDQQIDELKSFAQRENLEISEFLTEAETAKVPGRPVFNSLISLISLKDTGISQ